MAKDNKAKKQPNKIARWFKDLKGEIKKIYWPDLRTVLKNTLIVIVVVAIATVVIYLFDWLMSTGLGAVKDKAEDIKANTTVSDVATGETSAEALDKAADTSEPEATDASEVTAITEAESTDEVAG